MTEEALRNLGHINLQSCRITYRWQTHTHTHVYARASTHSCMHTHLVQMEHRVDLFRTSGASHRDKLKEDKVQDQNAA